MPRALAIAAAACAALLAGCGAERAEPPDPAAVAAPAGVRELRFPAAGLSFSAPANWRLERRRPPAVATLRSGSAIVSAFAYPRREQLPRTPAQLAAARDRLLAEIRERDPAFRVEGSELTEVAGAPAIVVRGEQRIQMRTQRTRSVHVFRGRAEYVFEALAEPAAFAAVEARVLAPLLASAELTGRVARGRRTR